MTDRRVIDGPSRDLGGFTVRRLLPAPFQRAVGPFVFFDHAGPATFAPGHGLDVRPHPHIGLATVTYLFEGEILHRDSLGTVQAIQPGAINWMTAGRGIVHSERTPPALRPTGSTLHGLQAWVALPRAHEDTAPSFVHYPASSIPQLDLPGVRLRLLVGDAYGARSPVQTLSEMLYIDAALDAGASLAIPLGPAERAVYVALGAVSDGTSPCAAGSLLILPPGAPVTLRADSPARIAILGGAPLDGPRLIYWNLVASSQDRIDAAKLAWQEERFPLVPGDELERIPLP